MSKSVPEIKDWEEIKDSFTEGSLILGNGASIAISDKFSYGSLLSFASHKGYISKEVSSLFSFLKTNDFEYLLETLFKANVVNQTLKIKDQATAKAYNNLRQALIRTIGDTHVPWTEASTKLSELALFMRRFKKVISLNYDLVVYWAMLVGNDECGNNLFKDCFIKGEFKKNWRDLIPPHGKAKSSTLVFYPHGTLSLVRDILGLEKKICSSSGASLLEKVYSAWNSTLYTPIFVAEGTSNQKLGAIYRSDYLRIVLEDVIPDLGQNIVIYGWSMAANDSHILNAMRKNKNVKNIALSVHKKDSAATITQKLDILRSCFPSSDLILFNSAQTQDASE